MFCTQTKLEKAAKVKQAVSRLEIKPAKHTKHVTVHVCRLKGKGNRRGEEENEEDGSQQ